MTGVKEATAALGTKFSSLALIFQMAITLRSVLTGVMMMLWLIYERSNLGFVAGKISCVLRRHILTHCWWD